MRSLCIATLLAFLANGAAWAETPAKADPAEVFRDLTEKRAAAHIAHDRAFYEKLLGADFVLVEDNGGFSNKQQYLDAEFASKLPEGAKPFYSIRDFRVVTLRQDFAVVTYLKTEGVKLGEQTYAGEARRLDTYAREEGQWRLVTMVASRVVKPPKPVYLTVDQLKEYVGTYSVAPGIDSVILVTDGNLTEHSTDQQVVTLQPLGYDTFFDPDDSPTARTIFRRDASGKVIAWSYVNGDQEVTAKKDK